MSLETILCFLNDNVTSLDTSLIQKCELKVKEIEQLCSRRLSQNELEFYCSMLFQSQRSLLNFLTKTTTCRQHKVTRELILNFLALFIQRIGNFIRPHFKEVLKICSNIILKDRYSKNKDKALHVLDQLVKLRINLENDEWIKNLVNVLLQELAKTSSNSTSTVRGHVLRTLGNIARFQPDKMSTSAPRWYNIMLKDLKMQMITSSDGGDLQLIKGSLEGLHGLLFHFQSVARDQPECLSDIHKFARMALTPQTKLTQYGVPLAAMKLFQDHAHMFSSFLIEDYRSYYGALESWFEHNNHQLKHSAHMAIEAYLKQIARTSEDDTLIQSKEMFLYFIKKFGNMIKSDTISSKEMSLAVQGYGMLAGSCKKLLTSSDVYYMCLQMITRCEHLFLRTNELDSDKIHRLPTFVNALGNIVKQIQTCDSSENEFHLPESCLKSLEQVCVLMIENYPRLHNKYLFLCHNSLLSCIHAFVTKPELLRRFQYCLAYQGLIRSCSFDVVFGEDREKLVIVDKNQVVNLSDGDAEIMDDIMQDTRTVTFSNYVPLWVYLLQGMHTVSHSTNLSSDTLELLLKVFTSCYIDAVVDIIEKLNLKTVTIDDESDAGSTLLLSQVDHLQADSLADFRIFVNLCDLCSDVFSAISHNPYFILHINRFAQKLVAFSTKFPLVSGFYKLLTALMKMCGSSKYFATCSDTQVDSVLFVNDDVALVHYVEREQFLSLMQKFVIELSHRLKQFKDELLNSALMFVLSVPNEIASGILQNLSSTLKMACQVGNDYLPLALAALNAIKIWKLHSFSHKIILSHIVPYLEPFLHFSDDVVLSEQFTAARKKRIFRKSKFVKDSDDLSRKKVRSQVMQLFGSLGNDVVDWLKQSNVSNEEQDITPWDSSITVDYSIPFRDVKPTVRLDQILWRVMSISKTSSNRKAKIAACELLHSITLYIIGKNAQKDNAKLQFDIAPLYDKLFPAIFSLACDNDQVCRQLFRPLINQLIHWFTKNKQFEHPSTVALLNTIMDGLVDQDNAGLRDLCSKSLCEFLTWSIKQNKDDGYSNAKSIMKRIYSFALHPSPVQRLGSYLGFNHLYKVFRENNKLVGDFTFEMFVVFIDSLSLSHYDDPSYGTISLCIQALSHLERIITVKHEMLNDNSSTRRVPKGFCNPVILSSLVSWLFDQVGRPQTECRHQCMQLFMKFIKLLPYQEKSPLGWITNVLKNHGIQYIVKRFESSNDGLGIATHPLLTDMSRKFSVKSVLNWLDLVLSALESYLWVFEEGLLSPEQVFNGNHEVKLFESLEYFIRNVVDCDVNQIPNLFRETSSAEIVYSPQEKKQYYESKCFLISRLLHFIKFTLKTCEKNSMMFKLMPESLWCKAVIPSLLSSALVVPATIGFETFADPNIAVQLSKLSSDAIMSIIKILPTLPESLLGLRQDLFDHIKDNLKQYGPLNSALPRPFGTGQANMTSLNSIDLVQAYTALFHIDILSEVLQHDELTTDLSEFAILLLNKVFSSVITTESAQAQTRYMARDLSSGLVSVGGALLSLAFLIGISPSYLVEKLLTSTPLSSLDGAPLSTTHGAIFLSCYSKQICGHLCSKPDVFIPLICDQASNLTHACGSIICTVLDHLAVERSDRKRYSSPMCGAILREWGRGLVRWWRDPHHESHSEGLNNVVSILKKVLALDASVFHQTNSKEQEYLMEMYTMLLSSPRLELSFKNKILDLLPFFLIAEEKRAKIEDALEQLVATHFPLTSREFAPGSSTFCQYSQVLHKLLSAIKDCVDVVLLKVIVRILCREQDHVMKDDIQSAIEEAMTSKLMNPNRQIEWLSMVYQLYRDTTNYPFTFRSLCISQVFIPVASHCDVTSVIEFFANHVTEVMDVVKEESTHLSEGRREEYLGRKMIAYRLMETMFTLIPEDHIVSSSSVIGRSFATSQSQDSMLKTFMKCATKDRKSTVKGVGSGENNRVFHCAVYNAMIAAVVCTKKDVTWYKAFLFDESPHKKQLFLDDLIDLDKEYYFLVEIGEPLKKRSRFTAIRKQKQDADNSSVNYMSSVYASSLSEDVSVFDANTTRSYHTDTDMAGGDASNAMDTHEGGGVRGVEVTLECDELNMHESMATMVALIQHMEHNSIGFSPDDPPDKLPTFLTSMHRKLSSNQTNKNVRIFIARLIINCASTFKRYATHWVVPLTNLVVRGDLGSNGINYMVADVMATVLSWNDVAIPEDTTDGRNLVQAVVEKLCQDIHLEKRALTRHNLDLIKTVLECWGQRMTVGVDPSIVYGLCGSYDDGSLSNYAGLQLLGALLSNGVAPYTPSYTVDRMAYFRKIFVNITKKRKEAHESASEAAGMTLEYLSQVDGEIDGEVHDLVTANLNVVYGEGEDRFINCLHKVALHHSRIVDIFLSKVFFVLPKLRGELRNKALEILLQRGQHIPDLYRQLKAKDFTSMLVIRDDNLQLVCIRLCHELLSQVLTYPLGGAHEAMVYFLPTIFDHFSDHPNPLCRQELLDLATIVYDFEMGLDPGQHSEVVMSGAKLVLVKLLADPEEAIRNQVVNFWNSEKHLPVQPCSKLHQIVLLLYEPTHQDDAFLRSIVTLLLQSASLSPDYERALFEHPLSECSFQEYSVDHNWRVRHAGATPMFVDTLQSSVAPHTVTQATQQNVVKATQHNMQFVDTLAGGRNTFNWMTGSSLDTFASMPPSDDSTGRSGLATTLHHKPQRSKNLLALLKTSADEKGNAETKRGVDVDVSRLRRRFIKETKSSMFKYARIQEEKKQHHERSRKELKKRLENEVQMHRKYREGELPDIEIANRALIAPLAAACQYDAGLAALLAPILVSSLINPHSKATRKDERQSLLASILDILTRSQEKSPLLIGFVEDICFHNYADVEVDFSLIASASLASKKEELGIALMEQILLSKDADANEPSRKRKRMEVEPEVEVWYEMARLYKSLGDYDVIEGIFSGRGASEATSRGLKYEASGSFKEARKVYEKALLDEEDAKEVEKDLWEDCLLGCLKNLCSWDNVDRMCHNHLSSYQDSDSVSSSLQDTWKHPDFIERYLESSLHAKLILLLQGDTDAGDVLASFMDDAMRSGGERKEMMEKKFAEHLVILYIHQEEYSRAKHYLRLAMEGVSSRWTLSGAGGNQEVLLKSLSRYSDMNDFLDAVDTQNNQQPSLSTQLLSKWTSNCGVSPNDPVTSSYHHVMHRSFLLNHLPLPSASVEECKVMMRLNLMEAAALKRNFAAARRILSMLDEVYDQIVENTSLCVALAHKTAVYYHAQARHQATMHGPSTDNLNNLLAAFQSLTEQNSAVNQSTSKATTSVHLLLLASSYHLMADNVLDASDDLIAQVQATLPSNQASTESLRSSLTNSALSHLQKACSLIQEDEGTSLEVRYNTFLQMVEFCHKIIIEEEMTDSFHIATLLNRYVMKAMQINGSSRSLASFKFPLLLQLLERFPQLRDHFIKEASNLPSWVGLAWISHMVALLDRKFASAFQPFLIRIANEYPQAVVYPFTTSLPGYKFNNDDLKENKKFVKCMKRKLEEQVPQASEFIKHLRYVAHPYLIFRDWHSDFTDLLSDKEQQKASLSDVLEAYQNMYKDLFDCSSVDGSLYGSSTGGGQLLRSKFAKEYKKECDEIFGGSTGTKVVNMKKNIFSNKTKNLLEKMKKFDKKSQSLKAYSHWLADYHPLQHGVADLEIPGQYHGRSRPQLEYHVTIAGFTDKVLMMPSLRKPCRISIRGSDMKEHRFLVKGGEDMRQDQRVESMFECINRLLDEDSECRSRNMRIRTYQVVPISCKVGVIEWVDDVITFWEMVQRQSVRMNCEKTLIALQNTDWVPKGINSNNHLDRYGRLMTDVSHTDAVSNYYNVVKKLPQHIFRNAYLHLASNSESFIRLRKRFVTSYSVMCIAHWLLGIGDRHTTNFLISTSSGYSIGIDFGHAFGSATEILHVPEVVPFRLTRQISGLLSPHDVKQGEMRQIMVRCLAAIRVRSHTLLPMLDVFIKDPSVDWMKSAKKSGTSVKRGEDICWKYASSKVEVVKSKLNGGNPASITCHELNQNRIISRHKKGYVSVAKGGKGDTYRSTVAESGTLDVAVQVDCLLDQATDPNILGRTWAGWKSWC